MSTERMIRITLAGEVYEHRHPGPWTAEALGNGCAWIANAQGINYLHIPAQPFAKLFLSVTEAQAVADALNAPA